MEKLQFVAGLSNSSPLASLGRQALDHLRLTRKFSSVLMQIIAQLAKSSVKTLLSDADDDQLRTAIHDAHISARNALETMGFEVEVTGLNPKLMREKNFLIVGNHMSYMDILVFASVQPVVFVTSVDMGQVPVLGHLARSGGSIFVERRHRERREHDRDTLAETLKRGLHVLIYPEGTSTNGLELKTFKKGLLTSAQVAGVDILPVVTTYVSIDGEPFDRSTCDRIAWYGDMKFAPHLLQLLRLKKVKARLEFLPPIAITPELTRDEIASRVQTAIAARYPVNAN